MARRHLGKSESTVGRSIKSLGIALIKATLLLVALCLWLAWGVRSTADRVSGNVGASATDLRLIGQDLQELSEEVRQARVWIDAALTQTSAGAAPDATDQLDRIETELASLNDRLASIDLKHISETAVSDALDQMVDAISALLGPRIAT